MKKLLRIMLVMMLLLGAVLCGIAMAADIDDIDMEAGDESEWSNEQDADNDINATAGSALAGTNYGLDVRIDDGNVAYKRQTQADTGTRHFRLRFYFDPNSLTMANYDEFDLIRWVINPSPYNIWRITFKEDNADNKFLDFRYYHDAGASAPDSEAITDEPHYIEIYTLQSLNADSNGVAAWYIDGVKKGEWTSIDNNGVFAGGVEWQAGAVAGMDAGTSGAFFMDQFVVRDANDIIGAYSPPAAGGSSVEERRRHRYYRQRH